MIDNATFQKFRNSNLLVLIVSTMSLFTDTFIYTAVIPVLPFVIQKIGGEAKDVGFLVAAFSLGILVGAPIFGWVSDRFHNRKIPFIVGLLAMFLATILFGVGTNSYAILFVARFLQGASGAAVWVMGLAMIADVYPENRIGFAMGVVMSGFSLGQSVGPPIGGVLYQSFGMIGLLICVGCLLLIDLSLRIIVNDTYHAIEDNKEEYTLNDLSDGNAVNNEGNNQSEQHGVNDSERLSQHSQQQQESEQVRAVDNSTSPTSHGNQTPLTLWQHLKQKKTLVNLFLIFTVAIVFSALEPSLPIWLEKVYKFDAQQVGVVFLALIVPDLIAAPLSGWLYDRFGYRKTMLPSIFLCFSSFLILIIPNYLIQTAPLIICLCLAGFTIGLALTPLLPEIAKLAPKGSIAKSYGMFNIIYSAGLFVGPVIGSILLQYTSWTWVCGLLALFMFLCLPLVFFYDTF